MTAQIDFYYSPPSGEPNALPTAVAWLTTQLQNGSPSDYPVSWDVDTRFFKITSLSGDTQIQAYASKSEMRELGDATNGDYVAIGNSLMLDNYYPYDKRDTLLSSSSDEVDSIPADGDASNAILYWTGWRDDAYINTVFTDPCTSLDNWSTANTSDWSQVSGTLQGTYSDGSDAAHLLTLSAAQDFSSYVPGTVLLSWDQETSAIVFSDGCSDFGNWTAGSAWSYDGRFIGNNNPGGDDARLSMSDSIDLSMFTPGSVTISWEQSEGGRLEEYDILYYAFSSDNGSSWSTNEEAFHDDNPSSSKAVDIPAEYLTDQFKMRFELAGFDSTEYCYIDNIKVSFDFPETGGLDFSLSSDGGAHWSENVEAFRGEEDDTFLYYLPAVYTSSIFKVRFQTVGLTIPCAKVYLDNIKVRVLLADNTVSFEIEADGDSYSTNVTAESTSVLLTSAGSAGFAFACHTDVTDLVIAHAENTTDGHRTGNAVYTVGDLNLTSGDLQQYLSHAGWSLVIVYNSPSTAGHYLYLYDYFAHNGGGVNLDFDWDGVPGGDVTDFIIPEPIRDKNGNIIEEVAARINLLHRRGRQ
jgi:hypothetical protein